MISTILPFLLLLYPVSTAAASTVRITPSDWVRSTSTSTIHLGTTTVHGTPIIQVTEYVPTSTIYLPTFTVHETPTFLIIEYTTFHHLTIHTTPTPTTTTTTTKRTTTTKPTITTITTSRLPTTSPPATVTVTLTPTTTTTLTSTTHSHSPLPLPSHNPYIPDPRLKCFHTYWPHPALELGDVTAELNSFCLQNDGIFQSQERRSRCEVIWKDGKDRLLSIQAWHFQYLPTEKMADWCFGNLTYWVGRCAHGGDLHWGAFRWSVEERFARREGGMRREGCFGEEEGDWEGG